MKVIEKKEISLSDYNKCFVSVTTALGLLNKLCE